MADELKLTPTQVSHFEYATSLAEEMHVLFERHEALAEEYSEAMKFIEEKNWRSAYVHWVAEGDSVEGGGTDG